MSGSDQARQLVPADGRDFKKPVIHKVSGSTGRSRQFISELHDAIRRVETRRGKRLVDHLVDMAFEDKTILLAVARKILPDLKHVEAHSTTDTEITIRWDVGGPDGIIAPDSSNAQLSAGNYGPRGSLPPPDGDSAVDQPEESPASRSEATLTREVLLKKLDEAQKSGSKAAMKAVFEEVIDISDEDYDNDDSDSNE